MAVTAIQYQRMTLIKLSGSLAKKFGRDHLRQLDSGQAWEAFKALKSTIEGFEEAIRRLERLGMRFAIFRNRKNIGEGEFGRGGAREILCGAHDEVRFRELRFNASRLIAFASDHLCTSVGPS